MKKARLLYGARIKPLSDRFADHRMASAAGCMAEPGEEPKGGISGIREMS
jgi:hypothetical protein